MLGNYQVHTADMYILDSRNDLRFYEYVSTEIPLQPHQVLIKICKVHSRYKSIDRTTLIILNKDKIKKLKKLTNIWYYC